MATYDDFTALDIRVGQITQVEALTDLKKPAYRMTIDFGPEIGTKISLGQYTPNYPEAELKGRLVACLVNLPPLKMGPYVSEVLTLGFPDEAHNAVLIAPTKDVPLGGRLY